jgi:Matrixin
LLDTAVSLCVLLTPAAVSAYKIGYIRPGPQLTYFVEKSAKSRTWEARMAARAWNRSGARVRVKEVHSRRSAMIIVHGAKIGTGFTGTNPGPHRGVSLPMGIWITTERKRSPVNVAMIMAHEFGHTLGLAHTKGCALMNPASGCAFTEGDFERWKCRMLRPDDVRGVASLWGGRWAPKLPKGCPRESSGPTAVPASWRKPPPNEPIKPPWGGPLNPPSNLAASYDPSGDGTAVVITFRNTTSSLLGSVRVYWKYGACPTMKANEELDGVHIIDPATPREQVRIDTELPSLVPRRGERRVCVAAWSLDRNASAVSAGVTATFDVPPGA